ncbi:MAG: HTTM domain-containing protein [Pseudomonadota bacterium]
MSRLNAQRSWAKRVTAHLGAPVSIQSLVVIRVAFGLILAWDCWRYIKYDRISRYYVEPDVLFPFLPFVQPLPEPWIHIVWGGVGLFGVMVALGLFYRTSIIALTGIFAYFFLLDRAQYLNHNYMVILFGVLLCFAPAAKAYSLDAWLKPATRSEFIPRWPVSAVKLQLEIILIYAGWVKITEDWLLRAEPLRDWLHDKQEEIFFGLLFNYDWAFYVATWGTVALHIIGAPLLLWRRTRLAVFCVYAFFHWSNATLFNIGIFPWITLALTTIFFAPDWPSRLVGRFLGRFTRSVPATPAPSLSFRLQPALLTGLAVWFAVQIYLPERQHLFANNVGWTGDGHRFSWRMRIYDRDREGVFRIISADGAQVWEVDPHDWMARRQARNVIGRPDIAWTYAQHLKQRWAEQGYPDVAVYADVQMSLNGRPWQQFTDPNVDLTQVPWTWLAATDWVVPMHPVGSQPAEGSDGRPDGEDIAEPIPFDQLPVPQIELPQVGAAQMELSALKAD